MKSQLSAFAIAALCLFSCRKNENSVTSNTSNNPVSIQEDTYGKMPDGSEVKIFTLENAKGCRVKVMEYGATLVSVETPDRDGKIADLTHGYDKFEQWLKNYSYFGSTVGRYGNRIAGGKFTLEGKEYTLAKNNEPGGIPCSLHGGIKGFDKVLWKGTKTPQGVAFKYLSKDGEEGFPGNLDVTVTYTLNEDNELTWLAEATTDAPTVVNMVQHVYWNLSGDATQPVADHELTLNADRFLPTTKGLIPTGEWASVEGTPMDFRKATPIGKRIDDDYAPLKLAGGYDHAWVLDGAGDRQVAVLSDPKSGRVMEVSSDARAIQVYTGNFMDGSTKGKGGTPYQKRTSVCLETEAFPDAPNQPEFPSTVLRPGETYRHTLTFKFSAK